MTTPRSHLAAIDSSQDLLTLSVGWRSGQKTKLGKLLVGSDVADELRLIVQATLTDIQSRTSEVWTPDADLSLETYLVISLPDLGSAPVLAAEHGSKSLHEALGDSAGLPVISPEELPAADLTFYAVTIGNDPEDRITFLRRTNPRRGLRRGRMMTAYRDVLTRIDEPLFGFEEDFDLIFTPTDTLILSQSAFVALFRGQSTLLAQVPKWTQELSAHVPITSSGQERLTAKSIRDSRARTRLEAIVKRGHLADVSTQVLKQKMDELGLESTRLIDENGELRFEDEDISTVLYFLNEDLFTGALTSLGFRADRKAQR